MAPVRKKVILFAERFQRKKRGNRSEYLPRTNASDLVLHLACNFSLRCSRSLFNFRSTLGVNWEDLHSMQERVAFGDLQDTRVSPPPS